MKTKICSKCGKKKDVSEFYKRRSRKNGLMFWCKGCIKKYRQKNPIRTWSSYTLSHHKWDGYKVNITFDELYEIAKNVKYCPLCDVELDWTIGIGYKYNSPSLDRKDNQKILTKDNVWIICKKCNTTKLNRTFNEFVEYCGTVYNKFKKAGDEK